MDLDPLDFNFITWNDYVFKDYGKNLKEPGIIVFLDEVFFGKGRIPTDT